MAKTVNRRKFLGQMGVAGIAVMAVQSGLGSSLLPNPKEYKYWAWVHGNADESSRGKKKRLTTLKEVGITGILIGGNDTAQFFLAKDLGLEAHAWMWTLNRGEEFIRNNHPEWYSMNRKGESCFDKPPYVDYYRWLCPSQPEVLNYLQEQVAELLEAKYIDGIHLDYIRYNDVILPSALWEKYDLVQDKELPEFDYCYCDTCRHNFQQQHGSDPLKLEDPPSNIDWLQYRYDTVTHIVNTLSQQVRAAGKPISAAVFPTPAIAKKLVRQDWVSWDLDMIFPMVYQGFYEQEVPWVGTAVAEGVQALGNKTPLYAGLYLPDLPEPLKLKHAVQHALVNGAQGVSLFGEPSEEHWKQFMRAIQ